MDNADERRIPQGGSLQESRFQVWPAAIHPQTPSAPGTKGPPDFGRCGNTRRGWVNAPRQSPDSVIAAHPDGWDPFAIERYPQKRK